DNDAVANTNEFEYAIVNRFFTRQLSSDLMRRRAKGRKIPSNMKPVQPDTPGKVDRQKESPKPDESKPDSTNPQPTPQAQPDQKPQQPDVTKPALETGKSEELGPKTTTQKIERTTRRADDRKKSTTQGTTGEDAVGNEAETQQSYEVLTIKVAQKYF